jgi:endoglucanase
MQRGTFKRWLMASMAAGAAMACAPLHAADGKKPAALPVGACINLGNHLDMVRGEITNKRLDADDFRRIRAAGFDTVRLTVNWSGHSAATPPMRLIRRGWRGWMGWWMPGSPRG